MTDDVRYRLTNAGLYALGRAEELEKTMEHEKTAMGLVMDETITLTRFAFTEELFLAFKAGAQSTKKDA